MNRWTLSCLVLVGCARTTSPSETVCYLEPSMTPEAAQAAIDAANTWEHATDDGFRCVTWVYAERSGNPEGTIAFRIAASLDEPGLEILADTNHVHGRVDALVTIAPATLTMAVDLRTVISHELGHALNIYPISDGGHAIGGAPSVMRPLYADQTPAPTPRDVDAFWAAWR